jgi:iron(III) transport system ATP-binding protein
MLCIRPEFIRVVKADDQPARNRFHGRVETLVFVGEAYEGEIRIGETRLIVRIGPETGVVEGDEITITVAPDHCVMLRK